jgi:hypothetical protein
MHDGAPAHFSRAVREVLSNFYHAQWIGTGGHTELLHARLVLNPLDFYLLGHLNTFMYAPPDNNEETLHHRIVNACQTIRNYPGIFERRRRFMMRRVEECIDSPAGHFEHL